MNADLIRYNRAILMAELYGFTHYAEGLRADFAAYLERCRILGL